MDVIDVNNNAPRVYFNSREYQDDDIIRESYRENRRGQEVIEIEADDADSGSNGDIGWSLDPNDPDSIYFRLVPEAPSAFSTRSRLLVFFVQPPDYEQKTTYDIAIICFDKPLYPEQPNETRLRVSIRRVFKWSINEITMKTNFKQKNFQRPYVGNIPIFIINICRNYIQVTAPY